MTTTTPRPWARRADVRRVLQRQIMPADRDTDVLSAVRQSRPGRGSMPTSTTSAVTRRPREPNKASIRQSTSTGRPVHPDHIESRTALRIPLGGKLSFGTYFNAFPASYWRRWSVVNDGHA